MRSIIDDPKLADAGRRRIRWFAEQMPLMTQLQEQYRHTRPLKGLRIATCMHVEPKTAYWLETLLAAGTEHIDLVGGLGTTKSDTAAYLAQNPKITIWAKTGDTMAEHEAYAEAAMENRPHILLDNGAVLIRTYCSKRRDWTPLGANEETRTGRILMDDAGIQPPFPVLVIDDSPLKRLLENAIGVGQSVVDGFMRATSLLLGGKRVLVIGYGYVGSGIAQKFRAMGAHTSVYDIDPVFLLKAKADGHRVDETLENLLSEADVIVTATGRFHIIRKEHISLMRDGVILCNAGHFGFEIDADDLRAEADCVVQLEGGKELFLYGERRIFLLENANPINLSAGTGNPIEIMDLGLGLQASCAVRLAQKNHGLANAIQPVPHDIDEAVSRIMLRV